MMEMTNTLNNGMCRCCSSEGTFKDIKTKYHWMGEEEVYADMLTDCFDIKISTPEDMDNGICEVCITQLRNAANFKKQVLHTEAQFKRRLQNKEIKNPIKLESMDEDPIESDHLSDPDFSSNEYEVPIKEELEDKPKAKKRAAKATTSRAKKPKAESEPAKKRNRHQVTDRIIRLSVSDIPEMDGIDLIDMLNIKEDLSDENRSDRGQNDAEANRGNAASPTEYIFKYESNTPSPDPGFDEFETVLNSDYEYLDEINDFSSNIEYLDETEEEFRLTESIQRSKEKAKIQMVTNQRRRLKTNQPVTKNYGLRRNRRESGRQDLEEDDDKEIQLHHENLRTIIRNSNATTFVCRGIWYFCTICKSKYTKPRELKAHTLKTHNTLKSQKKLFSARKMQRYVVKLDITNLKCRLCTIGIASLKELMGHLNTDHGEPMHMDLPNHIIPFKFDSDVLRCTECDREFAFFKMLQCHMNDHYKNYTCEVCDTSYVTSGSLTQHTRLHADGEYTCNLCKKVFDTKRKLTDHVKLVHLGEKMRNKCAYCDMKFHVFETKNKHMEEVHGVKTPVIKCQACDKTFKSTRHLTAHMKSFHMVVEKNHQCPQCDKRFSAPHMLKGHMTVHSSEKDFKCAVCDKAYSRKKTLREHIRIHANDRRFKCELCGMAFVQKCSLTGHMKSKHPDKDEHFILN